MIGGQTVSLASGGTPGVVLGGSSTVGFSSSATPKGAAPSISQFVSGVGRNSVGFGWLLGVGIMTGVCFCI